jgi:hypothetical protein
MKPILATLAASLCLFVAGAQAQTMQPIKMRPIQPAPAAVQPGQLTMVQTPEMEIAKLERENRKLREENAALKKQVDDFTALGGSNVHAYCPAGQPTISRNTSGAEANCGAAGYTCEPVSGQCRTSCQTSDMCAGGFTCDTGIQQCVRTG